MKKSDLQSGMCIQTNHNRYGFIELDRNRINICYDPDVIEDKYAVLEMVSLDDVYEFDDGRLGVGYILTQELKDSFPESYEDKEVGDICMSYEIVAVYKFNQIYYNGEGAYPLLKT